MNRLNQQVKLVVITGMSGAGKTVVIQSLEDIGYFCVDNLPPTLLAGFLEAVAKPDADEVQKLAVVIDMRGKSLFEKLPQTLKDISAQKQIDLHILFLNANNDTLVHRYKETRRNHPLAPKDRPLAGIVKERALLETIKKLANHTIDTTDMRARTLREKVLQIFSEDDLSGFQIIVTSFGFKHGAPIDSDLIMDVRFLPNPHYVKELRPQTGLDSAVYSYVFEKEVTSQFMEKFLDMLKFVVPKYKEEGKAQLVISIGCTGGQHRSVAIAEYIKRYFANEYKTSVFHRDI